MLPKFTIVTINDSPKIVKYRYHLTRNDHKTIVHLLLDLF